MSSHMITRFWWVTNSMRATMKANWKWVRDRKRPTHTHAHISSHPYTKANKKKRNVVQYENNWNQSWKKDTSFPCSLFHSRAFCTATVLLNAKQPKIAWLKGDRKYSDEKSCFNYALSSVSPFGWKKNLNFLTEIKPIVTETKHGWYSMFTALMLLRDAEPK